MSNLEKINILTKEMLDSLDLSQYKNQMFGTTDENEVSGGSSVIVDSILSATSENPVQNKVITEALKEETAKRELLYDKDKSVNITASTLTTLADYFNLFEVDSTATYFCRIGTADNSKFKNIVNKPSSFGNYIGCFIKKEIKGFSSTGLYNCYKLLAIDDFGNKTAIANIFKDSNGTIIFTGWTVIGG